MHIRFIVSKFDCNHIYHLQSSYANGKPQEKLEMYL